tara:strand:+ start:402 stop:2501 length:2100 start_codon:yes stop_codon:yes gene_type:complete
VIFSIFLISSLIIISATDNVFAEEIVVKSTSFEDSTILELSNNRGNDVNVNTVRIWLSEDNEFKTFKTEQGWTGRNTPQGVIIFTAQNELNPGESVKFGIKTILENPVINWKAVDLEGNVISSASVKTQELNSDVNVSINQPKSTGIKDESSFRFIPEKPSSGSSFRVIGENFVPDNNLDFYIGDDLTEKIHVDNNGRILFTSKLPEIKNDERIEFALVDSSGNEKILSIRIHEVENREFGNLIKLSLGNTQQEVKRGETIILQGMGTSGSTLTITSKQKSGDILAIETIQVPFNGKWEYEAVISPEIDLGTFSIQVTDGVNNILRNFEVISAKVINITSVQTKYEVGEKVYFEGTGIPDKDMSVILEDPVGTEIFSRSFSIDDSGRINFEIDIPRSAIEGTYVLMTFQDDEQGLTIFGVGQEPEPIILLRPTKLNFNAEERVDISIQGPVNSQISLIIIDSADREKISESINLGPDGKEIYSINVGELGSGVYSINAKRGESSGSATFTIGLSTGSGEITVQTIKEEYNQGDQILIIGKTEKPNVLLDVLIKDPNGKTIKNLRTFSGADGMWQVDNFRIPTDGELGKWEITAKSGSNFRLTEFLVEGKEVKIAVIIDKESYTASDYINISGSGARMGATVTVKIFDSNEQVIQILNINAKSNGEYTTMWVVPSSIETGEYTITVDDGATNSSIKFVIT